VSARDAQLYERDAWEIADAVRAGDLSAAEVLDAHLQRVERFNDELNAFCFLDVDAARRRADEIDAQVRAGGDPGRFAGVPMGVKELAAVEGWPDTHGSKLYEHVRAERDGTEAARLREEGAVLVGLTTAPEFGSTNWTRTYLHGVTRNPWQPELTPGGSSGGSAAAVASGMMPICTGSDGGGSIRIPCSYSGLFGFKVSFGRVGDEGPFDDSLTAVPGPMARCVRDAARYVDVIAGPTVIDPTSLAIPPLTYEDELLSGQAFERLRGVRAAWSSTLGYAVCDPEVEKIAHEAALALCDDAGIELVDVDVRFPNAARAWGILSTLSMAANHLDAARGHLDDVTPVPRAGFEMIERLAPDELLRAIRRRQELLAAIAAVFDEVDLLLTPTTATPAFVAEGPPPFEIAGQRVGGMGSVPFTAPFNVSGQPAVSIPAGTTTDGLPVGLQVVTRRHDEPLVLAAGLVAETNRPWPKLAPAYR
jgi:aspartyl-tRNA(Asn)/glutamyl-tRNA(Gln) amidotransferase subunit A